MSDAVIQAEWLFEHLHDKNICFLLCNLYLKANALSDIKMKSNPLIIHIADSIKQTL